jgi:hypothetical protein
MNRLGRWLRRPLVTSLARWTFTALLILGLAGNVCGLPWESHVQLPEASDSVGHSTDEEPQDSHLASCDSQAVQAHEPAVLFVPVIHGLLVPSDLVPPAPRVKDIEPKVPLRHPPPLFLLHAALLI